MYRDNHEDDPRDERCSSHSSDTDYKPRHAWADAVADRCTPIPEDGSYRSRHLVEEAEGSTFRRDPIPSDWLEKGAHYDPAGNLIPPEGIYDDPIIPAGDDNL